MNTVDLTKALECALEFASTDTSRPALNAVQITDDRTIGTDGISLVAVRHKKLGLREPLIFSRSKIAEILKIAKARNCPILVMTAGVPDPVLCCGDSSYLGDKDAKFPEWNQLLDRESSRESFDKIGVSPKLLERVGKSAKRMKGKCLEMSFHGSELDPIGFTFESPEYEMSVSVVVMPMRLEVSNV